MIIARSWPAEAYDSDVTSGLNVETNAEANVTLVSGEGESNVSSFKRERIRAGCRWSFAVLTKAERSMSLCSLPRELFEETSASKTESEPSGCVTTSKTSPPRYCSDEALRTYVAHVSVRESEDERSGAISTGISSYPPSRIHCTMVSSDTLV